MLRPLILGASILAAGNALADQLDVESPTTRENRVTIETNNTFKFGDVPAGVDRSSHSVGAFWGIVPGVRTGFEFNIANTRGGGAEVDGFTWSNTFGILGAETVADIFQPYAGDNVEKPENVDGFSLAAYTSLTAGTNSNGDGDLTTGPLFGYRVGALSFEANTLLKFPIGGGPDTSFVYSTAMMFDLTPNLAMGFEAHGEIAGVFEDGSTGNDTHYVGPVAKGTIEVEEGRSVGLSVGGFFGLTETTPDFAASMKLELEFD